MQEQEAVFKTLEDVAEALCAMFPKNLEVVLHDLTEPSQSIRHISGNVTGRKVGDAVIDLVIKSLHKEGKNVKKKYLFQKPVIKNSK